MKRYLLNLLFGCCALCIFMTTAQAQSAVYIYKNPKTGEGDYMFAYGMPSIEDAEYLALEKIIELGYAEDLVRRQASTDKKGYGMIIQSVIENRYGRRIKIYGVSLGCKTKEEAESEALENMKRYNSEWSGEAHTVVQRILDR